MHFAIDVNTGKAKCLHFIYTIMPVIKKCYCFHSTKTESLTAIFYRKSASFSNSNYLSYSMTACVSTVIIA